MNLFRLYFNDARVRLGLVLWVIQDFNWTIVHDAPSKKHLQKIDKDILLLNLLRHNKQELHKRLLCLHFSSLDTEFNVFSHVRKPSDDVSVMLWCN